LFARESSFWNSVLEVGEEIIRFTHISIVLSDHFEYLRIFRLNVITSITSGEAIHGILSDTHDDSCWWKSKSIVIIIVVVVVVVLKMRKEEDLGQPLSSAQMMKLTPR